MGFFKKKPDKKGASILKEETELKKKLERTDRLIAQANAAELRYKETGDVEEYLDFFRQSIKEDTFFRIRGSWAFRYPKTLIKEKRYDEAWSVLNRMYLFMPHEKGRISDMRYQILKSENKHPKDAIFHLMASYLFKVEGSENPKDFYLKDQKNSFIEKVRPLAKKAGFDNSEVEYLSYLLESEISKNCYSDSRLESLYSAFLKERE